MTDVLAPVAGLVRPLSEVPDPVFAAEMVGAGVAIEPDGRCAWMPCRPSPARCSSCTRTRSWCSPPRAPASSCTSASTPCRLDGRGLRAARGGEGAVEAGQPVTRWDPADVAERGLSPMVMLCVLDTKPGSGDQRPHRRHRRGGATHSSPGPPARDAAHGSPPCSSTSTAPSSTPSPCTGSATGRGSRSRGWPYDDEVAALFTGRRADDVFRTVDGPWRGEDPEALLAEIVALEPLRRLPEPVAGAVEAIAWARAAGIPLALVTSAGTRWAGRALEPFGGIDAFDTTVTREDIATGKPDPACYALACERLGVDRRRGASPARTRPTACARPPRPGSAPSSASRPASPRSSCRMPVPPARCPTSPPCPPCSAADSERHAALEDDVGVGRLLAGAHRQAHARQHRLELVVAGDVPLAQGVGAGVEPAAGRGRRRPPRRWCAPARPPPRAPRRARCAGRPRPARGRGRRPAPPAAAAARGRRRRRGRCGPAGRGGPRGRRAGDRSASRCRP